MHSNSYLSIIPSLVESDEAFPVDFDQAWEWVGFARKDSAKRCLDSNFKLNADFISLPQPRERDSEAETLLHPNVEQKTRDARGGHNREKVLLTIDCFKSFCMLAQTDRGQQVRAYFIDVEKRFKALTAASLARPPEPALPEPELEEEEIPRSSIMEAASGELSHLGPRVMREFAQLVRAYASASEIKPQKTFVRGLGAVAFYPTKLLRISSEHVMRGQRALCDAVLDGNPFVQRDLEALTEHLAPRGDAVYRPGELMNEAAAVGVFVAERSLSRLACASKFGRIISNACGKRLDLNGRFAKWSRYGNGNSRRYVLTLL